jgi:hypothetical protein
MKVSNPVYSQGGSSVMNKENRGSVNPTRRKLFKAVLGGGALFAGAAALPERWIKPMVQAVVVPAHAQLSDTIAPAAGAIYSVTVGAAQQQGTLQRFAQRMGELVPAAEAELTVPTRNVYVCVTPNTDGSKADVKIYVWYSAPDIAPCDPTKTTSMLLGTANVDVPSTGNLLDINPVCSTPVAPVQGNAGDLLDRLGIIKSAHATGATVDISSVTGGAQGVVHWPTLGAPIPFTIDPGECMAPQCCVLPPP